MFDKNNLIKLLSDFLSSQISGFFNKIILIKDNYFCVPEILTGENLLLESNSNSHFYLISHQFPIKRDIIKKQQIDQFKRQNFIIVYNSTDLNNDQFLDEMKQYYIDLELSPIKLISHWLGITNILDESLNFLSVFIWDLKDFIVINKDKILRVNSLKDNKKFKRVVEIIIKDNFASIIDKGKILSLMNNKNSWKLFLIFQESNYIYRKLSNIIKEKIGLDIEVFNYIKKIVLSKLEFKEILKIFIIAHFLYRLGEIYVNAINFSSFIDKFTEVHYTDENSFIKSLNRIQINILSKIFENYLKNTKSKEKLSSIFSLIKLLGDTIVNNSNLKEITIEMPSLRNLNIYEKCLTLSKIDYFYYMPLKLSELFFNFFNVRIRDLSHSLRSEDQGRIRKVFNNISGEMFKIFKGIDENYHNIFNFFKYFYKLCYNLFDIAIFNKTGFKNWNFRRWCLFYANYYIKLIKNLDAISQLNIQYNFYADRCKEIIKWFNSEFSKLDFDISKKFFKFIKLSYPLWVSNFPNPDLCPLLTANVFQNFINKSFSRELNNNFIILNDGCTLDNWRVLKKCIRNDFLDFVFEEKIGFSIIPSKTQWSRKAIFNADLMRHNEYFRGESDAFLNLLEKMIRIKKIPGDHSSFFNTQCEIEAKFEKVEQNIGVDNDLTQIIIFNFSDVLNEASIERVAVKDIIKNTYYPKIKKLLQIILRKHPSPNLYFITDHGITETKEIIKNLLIKKINSQSVFSLDDQVPKEICKRSPRLLQLHPDFTLDLSNISDQEKTKFLFIDDYNAYGLIKKKYDKMVIAHSYYTFFKIGKAHGGITMAEMIIPFARMLKKPIVSKDDFTQPKILIENKEEYEASSNYLKLSISNNNTEDFSDLKLHFISTNAHQIKRLERIRANTKKNVSIFCDDKGIEPILIKLDYIFRYNMFTTQFEFTLSYEDYREDLKSKLDHQFEEFF